MNLLEDLLLLSAIIFLLAYMGLFCYTSMKFFKIWRKFHEESLFHVGTLSGGMVFYFFIVITMIITTDFPSAIKSVSQIIGVVYSILCLEMSLFYVTTFSNRMSLYEKYIPFLFGITTGISLALFGVTELDSWFTFLIILSFIIPLILVSFLVARICIRTYIVIQDDQLKSEDRSFLKALAGASLILFLGALGDITFFLIALITKIDIWSQFTAIAGIIIPPTFIVSVYLIRKIFSNIEEADVVHLMNLLS